MNKEAFIAKHIDELVGLLVGAFGQSNKSHQLTNDSFAADGKFIIAQIQRAKALLGKIWEDFQPVKPK